MLFTAQDVATHLANSSGTSQAIDWVHHMSIKKVYIEAYRDGFTVPSTLLIAGRAAFEGAGFDVAGCVCTTNIGVASTGFHSVSNFAAQWTQKETADIFAYSATHFDELIIDDFFFTDDESAASKASLDSRSVPLYATSFSPDDRKESFEVMQDGSCAGPRKCDWSFQRRAMMKAVAERDVLAAVRAANPRCRVTLKFPNWYDHYQDHGYDIEAEANLFPQTFVGTETRDFVASSSGCKWAANIPATLGAFNLHWHSSVRSGGRAALGSWYDALCTSPSSYIEQARQAVLAGSPEHLLFHYGDLAFAPPLSSTHTGVANAAALRAAMPELRAAHATLHALTPVGVVAYKPVNSHGGCKRGAAAPRDQPCEGEAHVFDYVAAMGVPISPTHSLTTLPPAVLLSVHALKDPALPSLLKRAVAEGVCACCWGHLRCLHGGQLAGAGTAVSTLCTSI